MKRTTKIIFVIASGMIAVHIAFAAYYFIDGATFRGTMHSILTVLFILLFIAYWSVRDQIDRWG